MDLESDIIKKALLFTFIFLAVISSAWAFTGNTSNYTVQGDFVESSGKGNTTEQEVYFVITQQPIQINGYFDGKYGYVGFFPMSDNYTYYIPFENGSLQFFCNPSNVELDDSIICTASVLDGDGNAVNNARINWKLYNYNGIEYEMGDFMFVNNGVYKFRVPITQAMNFTTGDYYFVFSAVGFKTDYSFPVHITIGFTQDNILSIFAMLMTIISIASIIFGYWRRNMGFVVFGAFSLILIAMLMLEETQLFGETVSYIFAVIFALLGFLFLISMFLQKWKDKKIEKEEKNRIF